jgi:predicted transcriptional regulator
MVGWQSEGEETMPDEPSAVSANREFAVQIVAAYVRRNQIAADQMTALISTVHQALADLGKPTTEAEAPRTPAVPIRQSVRRDYVVCLDCGRRGQMLRRHLAKAHGLTVQEYRDRWKLPTDHAITAPGYSERRSTMAKQIGLGRGRASGETATAGEPPAEAQARPRRRGRARSAATPT